MRVTIAGKNMGPISGWDGAVVVNDKFYCAKVGAQFETLILGSLGSLLPEQLPIGTNILVTITVEEPTHGQATAQG